MNLVRRELSGFSTVEVVEEPQACMAGLQYRKSGDRDLRYGELADELGYDVRENVCEKWRFFGELGGRKGVKRANLSPEKRGNGPLYACWRWAEGLWGGKNRTL